MSDQPKYTAAAKIMVLAVLILLKPLIGGISGWLFALVFSDSFAVLQSLLKTHATGFELGAVLGFISACLLLPRKSK